MTIHTKIEYRHYVIVQKLKMAMALFSVPFLYKGSLDTVNQA